MRDFIAGTWLGDLFIQVRNATPAAVAVVLNVTDTITLDRLFKLYVVLQIAFLIWRWRKERKEAINHASSKNQGSGSAGG